MKVKVTQVAVGTHPSEVVVKVKTTTGSEQLVVHQRSIKDDGIEVGYPINRDDTGYLVELPRETITGSWRVWVPETVMIDS